VKLLFDENISRRLVLLLVKEFPGSSHPDFESLQGATDSEIWTYARTNGFVIVSKDSDLRQRAFLYGPPPKVIWLSVGNSGTEAIASLIRSNHSKIQSFVQNPEESLMVLKAMATSNSL